MIKSRFFSFSKSCIQKRALATNSTKRHFSGSRWGFMAFQLLAYIPDELVFFGGFFSLFSLSFLSQLPLYLLNFLHGTKDLPRNELKADLRTKLIVLMKIFCQLCHNFVKSKRKTRKGFFKFALRYTTLNSLYFPP